eukprot:scaffold562957_cov28-Prasinocladus_malaysianus.AAC.1
MSPQLSTGAVRVGLVGAGVSGLVFAKSLQESFPAGHVSLTVFEWGRGPGGRTARRRAQTEDGAALAFDHAAPYFTLDPNPLAGSS